MGRKAWRKAWIYQWEQRVEIFRRSERFWVLQTYTKGELIELQSINLQIFIDAIYEDVNLLESSSESILESTI